MVNKFLFIALIIVLFGSGCATKNKLSPKNAIINCETHRDAINEKIMHYNVSQNRELRDSNNTGEGEPVWGTYIEYLELKDLFYSPKLKKCVYLKSQKTLRRNGTDIIKADGSWKVIYDTYYLIDPTNETELEFVDGMPFLQITHRGEEFTPKKEIDSIISRYK